MPPGSPVCFGPFRFDTTREQLLRDGTMVPLQAQPARVLAVLVAHAGEVVTREQLRRQIWGDTWVNFDQGLNYCIRQIRIALNDDIKNPRFVQTLPQRGYRFIAHLSLAPSTPPPVGRRSMPRVVAASIVLLFVGVTIGLQTAAMTLRELAPSSDATRLAEHLAPLHFARGAWAHHIKPFLVSPRSD